MWSKLPRSSNHLIRLNNKQVLQNAYWNMHKETKIESEKLTRSIASRSSGVTVTVCGIASVSCPSMFLNHYWHFKSVARIYEERVRRISEPEKDKSYYWLDTTSQEEKDNRRIYSRSSHPSPSTGSFIRRRKSAWCSWINLTNCGFCFPSSWSIGCSNIIIGQISIYAWHWLILLEV